MAERTLGGVLVIARAYTLALLFASSVAALPARASDAPPGERRSKKPNGAPKGHVLIHTGAAYRRVYDIPIYAEEFGGCFGKWSERGTDCADMSLLIGRTQAGLVVGGVSFGYRAARAAFARSPFYAGVLPAVGALEFHRVTTGGSMSAAGVSLALFWGVRFYQAPHAELALEAAFNVDFYDTLIWGPTLALTSRL